jgi:hypothetical protein
MPSLAEPVRFRVLQPDASALIESARRGQFQMLAALARAPETGAFAAELTPHLYFHKARVVPIDPFKALRDGRVFEELALRIEIPAGQMLVVGVDPAAIPAKPPAEDSADQAPTRESEAQPEPNGEAPTTRPAFDPLSFLTASPGDAPHGPEVFEGERLPTLGELIFTGRKHGRPVQCVLIIAPINGTTARPAEDGPP